MTEKRSEGWATHRFAERENTTVRAAPMLMQTANSTPHNNHSKMEKCEQAKRGGVETEFEAFFL
jgi:hypothetical protein